MPNRAWISGTENDPVNRSSESGHHGKEGNHLHTDSHLLKGLVDGELEGQWRTTLSALFSEMREV